MPSMKPNVPAVTKRFLRPSIAMRRLLLLPIVCASLSGAVNDIFPTDYVATQIGETILTLYHRETKGDGYYRNGDKLLNDSVDTRIEAMRIAHTIDTYGYATSLIAVALHARADFNGPVVESLYPHRTSGAGDLRMGFTTWLVNDPVSVEYFALTPMIFLPTGDYDPARAFNIGENRYKASLNAGYVNRFMNNEAGELFAELSPEIVVYGPNSDARGKKIQQDPSYALTGYLRYRPIPIMGIFAGYQINRGGESIIDGIRQNDESDNERIMAGGAVFAYGTQIVLRYAKEVRIATGFRTGDEVTLRLQWRF